MKVNPVSNNVYLPAEKGVKTNKTELAPKVDKIEISGLGKTMSSSSQQKIDEIKSRMDSGFYNSPEVIDKVAEEILKEIRGE